VAILGGGLSGLMAGYRLTENGYSVVVLEGNEHSVGGRCKSKRFPTANGLYDNGQVYELGGELIDNSHLKMKQVAQEFGFELDNTINREVNGTKRKFFVARKAYDSKTGEVSVEMEERTEEECIAAFKKLWGDDLKKDYNDVSYPWLAYPPPGVFTDRSNELDQVPLGQYLEEFPLVVESPEEYDYFVQLLKLIYNLEWSGEPWEMSTLDLHSLLGTRGPGQFRFWGESNERFHVRGGNQQLSDYMHQKINERMGLSTPNTSSELKGVKLGHTVTKIRTVSNNDQELTIRVKKANGNGYQTITRVFDRVITTLPPSVYRNNDRVGASKEFKWYTNISEAGISAKKMQALQEVGFGPIAKINISFDSRFWNPMGWNGELVATTKYARYIKDGRLTDDTDAVDVKEEQLQQTWEVTRGQPGSQGILTDYIIGDKASRQDDGIPSTGRVINGALDATAPASEQATWSALSELEARLEAVLTELGKCDPILEQKARENLSVNTSGQVISSYESKNWWRDEFARGAFVFYKTNQETFANDGFSGVEPFAEPMFTDSTETEETPVLERKLHFAGSATNYDWNGWMEGAVISGEDTAVEVMSAFMSLGYSQSLRIR